MDGDGECVTNDACFRLRSVYIKFVRVSVHQVPGFVRGVIGYGALIAVQLGG